METLARNEIYPEDNDKFNDFVFCYWKKAGLLDENGAVNVLQLKVAIPYVIKKNYPNISENDADQLADQAVNACNENSPATATAQSSVLFHNCFVKYIHEKLD